MNCLRIQCEIRAKQLYVCIKSTGRCADLGLSRTTKCKGSQDLQQSLGDNALLVRSSARAT